MRCATLALIASLALPLVALAGEKYALVVGVEKYIPTELPSLDYAEDDAQALAAALERLGFSVITMTSASDNPLHRSTTAARILEQVTSRLDDREPSDTIVLAFSGHGLQFKGDKEFYFCPGEAELSDRKTLVPLGRVLEAVGRCRAGRKLLLVDACRDELAPKAAGKGVAIELDPAGVFRAEPPTGTVALFSCQPHEKSYELERLGHSVFTHHVVEYLSGAAPPERYPRKEVSVEELVPFVKNRTRETAATILGRPQKPEALAPDTKIPDWPLGQLGDLAGVERKPAMDRPLPAAPPATEPPADPKPGEVIENSLGMKLVAIPASAERLPPFFIGQTEVTQGQWHRVMGSRPAFFGPDGSGAARVTGIDADSLPVESISWTEAVNFCRRLTELDREAGRIPERHRYRPPSAEEWIAALRAGQPADADTELAGTAWCAMNADRHPHPVAGLAATAAGLHDLLGNVAEWCADQQPDDDDGRLLRMVRGGSWLDDPKDCTPTHVSWLDDDGRLNTCGLRVVLSPADPPDGTP